MTEIKLYGYANSPFVRKTTCFLFYKGLDFTHIPVDPIKPKKTIAFTNKSQVPVLQIGEDWKLESSDHAYWLDELFPEKPLCPSAHRAKIEAIDGWISQTFLLSIFRPAIDGNLNLNFLRRGWRLAKLMNTNSPVPPHIHFLWPFVIRKVPFIKSMAQHMDLSESPIAMAKRIQAELIEHIGEGPYIAGMDAPTMLDLAIYPNFIWGPMFGLAPNLGIGEHPIIKAWLRRVSEHMPDNPSLTPDRMIVKPLSGILA